MTTADDTETIVLLAGTITTASSQHVQSSVAELCYHNLKQHDCNVIVLRGIIRRNDS
jgi:hypothetical protein